MISFSDYQIKGCWVCLSSRYYPQVALQRYVIYPQQCGHRSIFAVVFLLARLGVQGGHPWGLMAIFQGPGKSLGLTKSYSAVVDARSLHLSINNE